MSNLLRFEDGLCIANTSLNPIISKECKLSKQNIRDPLFPKLFKDYLMFLKPRLLDFLMKNKHYTANISKNNDFIDAACLITEKTRKILFKHVFFL